MKFIKLAVEAAVAEYDGKLPLVHYLKQFFKARPKLGSRDRRAIADAVYTYYRIAKFVPQSKENIWGIINWALEQEIIFNEQLQKACDILQPPAIKPNFDLGSFQNALSKGIAANEWFDGMLNIPDTFIRLRVAAFNVIPILNAKGLEFEQLDETAIAFPNGYNLSDALPEQFYVVQDYSSQKSLDPLFATAVFKSDEPFTVWDTCSGAGGKMLLLKDTYRKAHMLCTDIRPSILHNLRERAKVFYHKNIKTQILNCSDAHAVKTIKEDFDLVISDVPCSGSGTWARTPEQFYFFKENEIEKFATLQKSIANNAISKVKPGGYFVYITCSVFEAENESVVADVLASHPAFTLQHQALINGIDQGADCMFVALLKKNKK